MKNRIKSKPRRKPKNRIKEFRVQAACKIWQSSRDLYIRVSQLADSFPKNAKIDLAARVRVEAVCIARLIAQGANAASDATRERKFMRAMQAIYATVGLLYIARQWKYIDQESYSQIYLAGRQLESRLQVLCQTQLSAGQLN